MFELLVGKYQSPILTTASEPGVLPALHILCLAFNQVNVRLVKGDVNLNLKCCTWLAQTLNACKVCDAACNTIM